MPDFDRREFFASAAFLAAEDLRGVRLAGPLQHDVVGHRARAGRCVQFHGATP